MRSSIQNREIAETGFTIIEVMVSILLLSISLVTVFGAQFTAVASVDYSRNITQAVQLARCKMSELELDFQINGFQQGDVEESGECCEAAENEQSAKEYVCHWIVETIKLPDPEQMLVGDGDAGLLDDLAGDMGEGEDLGAMGMSMIGPFLPMVTNLLEQAIRRVTVTVEWVQGEKPKDMSVMQYVVHPTQGPLQLMQQANSMNEMSEAMNEAAGGLSTGQDTKSDRE